MKPFSLLFVDNEEEFMANIKEFFDNLGYGTVPPAMTRKYYCAPKSISHKRSFSIFRPYMDGTETLRLIREIDDRIQV